MRQWKRGAPILLWVITAIVVLGVGAAGALKFLQPQRWDVLFAGWGYPRWASRFVGAVELAGALALLVPRLAAYAAVVLEMVMIGAVFTLLTHTRGALGGGATPAFYAILLAVVIALRWRDRLGGTRGFQSILNHGGESDPA